MSGSEASHSDDDDRRSSPSARTRNNPLRGLRRGLARLVRARLFGVLVAIVITSVAFDTANQFFFSTNNLLGLVKQTSTLAILAYGETLILVCGEIDLSVGATYGLGAMITGEIWLHGAPFSVALLGGLACGFGVGLVNAFLITVVRVNSFVATLGMLNVVQGLTYFVSKNQTLNPSPERHGFGMFNALGTTVLPGGIPVQVVWLVGIGIAMWVLLHRTLYGFRLAAIGGNPDAARAAHLRSRRYKFWAFAVAGFLAALGGVIDFSLVGATDPASGAEFTFPVFAAVIIGGASLSGGRGSIIGTTVGALLLTVLSNGLSLIGVGLFAQLLFVGFIIIGAAAVDTLTSRGAPGRGRGDVQI